MAKRRNKFQDANNASNNNNIGLNAMSTTTTSQTLSMPPLLNTNLPPYSHAGNPTLASSSFHPLHQPLSLFNNHNSNEGSENPFGPMDWATFAGDDLFGGGGGLGLGPPVQAAS